MFKNFHFKNVFSSSYRILTPGYLNEFSHCDVVCIKCKGHAILLLKARTVTCSVIGFVLLISVYLPKCKQNFYRIHILNLN